MRLSCSKFQNSAEIIVRLQSKTNFLFNALFKQI